MNNFHITETGLSRETVIARCTETHLPEAVDFYSAVELDDVVDGEYAAELTKHGYKEFCGDESSDYGSKDGVTFDQIKQYDDGEALYSMIHNG